MSLHRSSELAPTWRSVKSLSRDPRSSIVMAIRTDGVVDSGPGVNNSFRTGFEAAMVG